MYMVHVGIYAYHVYPYVVWCSIICTHALCVVQWCCLHRVWQTLRWGGVVGPQTGGVGPLRWPDLDPKMGSFWPLFALFLALFYACSGGVVAPCCLLLVVYARCGMLWCAIWWCLWCSLVAGGARCTLLCRQPGAVLGVCRNLCRGGGFLSGGGQAQLMGAYCIRHAGAHAARETTRESTKHHGQPQHPRRLRDTTRAKRAPRDHQMTPQRGQKHTTRGQKSTTGPYILGYKRICTPQDTTDRHHLYNKGYKRGQKRAKRGYFRGPDHMERRPFGQMGYPTCTPCSSDRNRVHAAESIYTIYHGIYTPTYYHILHMHVLYMVPCSTTCA